MTDKGRRRSSNQDSVFLSSAPIGPLPNLFIVADGMGGHAAGDFASKYAINVVTRFVRGSTIKNPVSLLKRAFILASHKLFEESEKDKDKYGMGTTMVACVIDENKLYAANIGDSRLYVISDEIKQITMDHSLVEEMIRSGRLERDNGRNHPEKNIITKAMGSREEAMPDFFEVELKEGSRVLMCSDGLSNMVEDDEIADIIDDSDTDEKAVSSLINKANYYGGNDNISAIVISI